MKTCSACCKSFPATLEYFHSSKNRDDGLYPYCKVCARAKKREDYQRHKARRLEYQHQYYQDNADYVRTRQRAYDTANRELVNERERLRRQANADEINARRRERHKNNPEPKRQSDQRYYRKARHKIRARQLEWEHRNPDKKRATGQRYIARKNALPHTFTGDDWQRALAHFNGRCAYCGNPPGLWNGLAAEHYIPIKRGGGTVPSNIIPACQSCNSSKHDAMPDTWLRRKFGKKRAADIQAAIESYLKSFE